MTHFETMTKIQSLIGGRLVPACLGKASKLPQWRWTLETNGAIPFLQGILPFSVTKRAKILAALELAQTRLPKGSGLLSPDIIKTRDKLALYIKGVT